MKCGVEASAYDLVLREDHYLVLREDYCLMLSFSEEHSSPPGLPSSGL